MGFEVVSSNTSLRFLQSFYLAFSFVPSCIATVSFCCVALFKVLIILQQTKRSNHFWCLQSRTFCITSHVKYRTGFVFTLVFRTAANVGNFLASKSCSKSTANCSLSQWPMSAITIRPSASKNSWYLMSEEM